MGACESYLTEMISSFDDGQSKGRIRSTGVDKSSFALDGVVGEGGFGRVLVGLFQAKNKWFVSDRTLCDF